MKKKSLIASLLASALLASGLLGSISPAQATNRKITVWAPFSGGNLKTGELAKVNAGWTGMVSPINAQANAAGDAIVFMGSTAGIPELEWDVFVSHWDGNGWAEPINLTGPNNKRDEDPKFSPNGHTIVYKQNGVLATMEIDGSNQQLLTVGKEESSIPFFTADGKGIIFERGGSIWLHELTGAERVLWQQGQTHAYYPVGVDSERFLFTEVQSSQHDRTDWGYYDGRPAEPLFYSDYGCDNSDPWPYQDGSRFIFYVTGCGFIYKGGYNLALADLQTEHSYDMDDLNPKSNSHLLELGPSWSGTAKFPNK